MKLSTEEKNLLALFVSELCDDYPDLITIGTGTDMVADFIKRFDADPRTYRQEIAPAREPDPPTEVEAYGGPR